MNTPWSVCGQTQIAPAGLVNNPTPNNVGAIGGITSLPYIVPAGKILRIDRAGIEAHWGGSIVIWTGDGPLDAAKCLPTIGGANGRGDGSEIESGPRASLTGTWWAELGFSFSAGTKINLYVNSSYQPAHIGGYSNANGQIFGWWATGELLDAI